MECHKRYLDLVYEECLEGRDFRLIDVECPCCSADKPRPLFKRGPFTYASCSECTTTYTPRRPHQDIIKSFLINSRAREFWKTEMLDATNSQRLTKVYEPVIDWIERHLQYQLPEESLSVADFCPRSDGLIEAWSARNIDIEYITIDPYFNTQDEHSVISPNTSKSFSAILLDDSFAHTKSMSATLEWADQHLNSNGLLFIRTILNDGFDMTILNDSSHAFVPFERFVCPSQIGLQKLLQNSNFEIIEFSTPGQLDIWNVLEQYKPGTNKIIDLLLKQADNEVTLNSFQQFLQTNKLSSLGQIVARKKA